MIKTILLLLVVVLLAAPSMAANKVVVIPLSTSNSSSKLWGVGRPGTGLFIHEDPNGYCTSPEGTKFALSEAMVTWGSAANACPKDTWVCTENEMPSEGSCKVKYTYDARYLDCQDREPIGTSPIYHGWLADFSNEFYGKEKNCLDFSYTPVLKDCWRLRVWCCWK